MFAGAAGSVPPNVFARPHSHTASTDGARTSQPTINGTPMRFARSRPKPRTPRRWNSSRAKKPAIRKNSDIRKMWAVNSSTLTVVLGEVSTMAQRPGIIPGMNEKPAWKATPEEQGEGTDRVEGVQAIVRGHGHGPESDEVGAPHPNDGGDSQDRHAERHFARRDEDDVGGPDGDGSAAEALHRRHAEEQHDEEVHRDVADGDRRRVPAVGVGVQPDAEQGAVIEEDEAEQRRPQRQESVWNR